MIVIAEPDNQSLHRRDDDSYQHQRESGDQDAAKVVGGSQLVSGPGFTDIMARMRPDGMGQQTQQDQDK